jgi:hypothetical protein
MRKKSILTLVFACVLAVPVLGYCQQWHELVEQIGNGTVNWTQGIVQANGIGVPPESVYGKPQARPMALRAAKLDAMRNLLEVTKGVRIDSTTTVKNYAVENDVIMSRVQGVVRGAQVVNREYMSDGTVEVTMQMSLNGDLAHIVLPQDTKPKEPTGTQPSFTTPPPTTPGTKVYTGMVVDARGLNAKPAMSPKVIDENGQEVYGSAFVSREFAVQQGMSGYAKEISSAQKNQRVTDNPVTVKGIKTQGPGRSDIVISNADAAMLKNASENLSFMKKCRVMIVVD